MTRKGSPSASDAPASKPWAAGTLTPLPSGKFTDPPGTIGLSFTAATFTVTVAVSVTPPDVTV
ncbi:hypothetical protein D3C72_1444180 [compost metagenome]